LPDNSLTPQFGFAIVTFTSGKKAEYQLISNPATTLLKNRVWSFSTAWNLSSQEILRNGQLAPPPGSGGSGSGQTPATPAFSNQPTANVLSQFYQMQQCTERQTITVGGVVVSQSDVYFVPC
jgi:hypothetical protein